MFIPRFFFCVLAGVLLTGCHQNEKHPERNEYYQDVKTAKVIVRESYGAHTGITLPFKGTVESWLRMAGVATAGDDDDSADCIISIVAEGEPLKAAYGVSGDLSTGARLSGTIRIERPSLHKDEVRFSGLIKPPRRFPGINAVGYKRPENAPFVNAVGEEDDHPATGKDKAAFDGFKFQLANLMGRYFGRSVLLIALDDYNSKGVLRESAIEALAALGMPSVPYLVDAFRYCSPEGEKGVGEALERITGEKFGSDARRWSEWYSRQEQRK